MEKTTVALVNAAVSAIERKLKTVEEKINLQPPTDGRDGADGKDGKDGINGIDGRNGIDGKDGSNGLDGADGNHVINAQIDFDGHLTLFMSDGGEIDAGDLTSVWERSDKIVQIIKGGGGSSTKKDGDSNIQSIRVSMSSFENDDGTYTVPFNALQINTLIDYNFYNSLNREVSVCLERTDTQLFIESLLPLDDITLQMEYT